MSPNRKRHSKKTPSASMDSFKQEMLHKHPLVTEVTTNTNKPKLSQVLMQFIAPYEDAAETNEEFEKLFTAAVIGWNAAILDGEASRELIEETVKLYGGDPETRAILHTFMERKLFVFADDNRIVADFKLTHFPDGRRHLAVATNIRSAE